MRAYSVLIFGFISICLTSVQGDLSSKLKYYELVDNLRVHTIAERSVDEDVTIKTSRKHVQFSGLGRNFSIHLKPVTGLFSPDFKAKVIDKNNKIEQFQINKENFFEGKLDGDQTSQVTLYFDTDETITARIATQEEEIVVEPEWRHTEHKGNKAQRKSMVIYHTKDMIWPHHKNNQSSTTSFCGAQHVSDHQHVGNTEFGSGYHSGHHHSEEEHHRSKRSTGAVRCRLIAVADYKFYSGTGGSNIYQTVNYIVGVMQKTNLIYESTNFGGHVSLGFEIAAMIVHTEYTAVPAGTTHYNMDTSWFSNTLGLLNAFSAESDTWDDYCLAHLFTHQPFSENVLGLAYIAGTDSNEIGGICSPLTYINGVRVSPNTGWSSTMDTNGNTVLARQAELVTAHGINTYQLSLHEGICHNWGSNHDNPSSDDCAPSSFFGDGKYLMYPYSVTGADSNNDKFSSCSRASVGRVLTSKRSGCFSASSGEPICGNGRLDSGEECDGGYLTRFGLDSCCTNQCQLSAGSMCSPANYACCTSSCQMASAGFLCNSDLNCKLASSCDGSSFDCPAAGNKAYGTPCTGGFCVEGSCTPFCEFNNLTSCACSSLGESCRRCCRTGAGQCVPFGNNELLLDGQSCIKGYCSGGVCIETNPSTIERLFDFLENISFDAIAEMFRTNMVAFTQLFSLFLWIPLCLAVWCWDRKQSKKYRREMAVRCRKDRTLTFDEDKRNVKIKRKAQPKKLVPGPKAPLPPITPRSYTRRNRVEPVSPR